MANGILQDQETHYDEALKTPRVDSSIPMVLCADDDDSVRALCVTLLQRAGFRTDTARDGREALQRIEEQRYAAIVLDLDMPGLHGSTVVSILAKTRPEVLSRLVLLTALPSAAFLDLEDSVGIVLRKPVRNELLVAAVRASCFPQHRTAPLASVAIEGDATGDTAILRAFFQVVNARRGSSGEVGHDTTRRAHSSGGVRRRVGR